MRPTRRTVLAGGLLLTVPPALSACTGEARRPVRPRPVDPDVALRAAAVDRERQLLARYDALLLQQPDLTARLSPLRAEHAEHLAALGQQEQPPTGSPAAAPTVLPSPVAGPGGLPGLVQAERAAGAAHGVATSSASAPLAAVLAQLAASEASHPLALA